MAIVGMIRDGQYWESDDIELEMVDQLLDEIDGKNSTGFNSTGKNSTGTRRNSRTLSHIPPMKDADEVVKNAAELVKNTVERGKKAGDKKARAVDLINKLVGEGVDQGKVIKAVMEDLGITYANARYYYVSQVKKS